MLSSGKATRTGTVSYTHLDVYKRQILDVTDCPKELHTGDVLEFRLDYAAILQLSMRADIDVRVTYTPE